MQDSDADLSAAKVRRGDDELYLDIRPRQGELAQIKQDNEKMLKDLMRVERRLKEFKPQTSQGKEAISNALN